MIAASAASSRRIAAIVSSLSRVQAPVFVPTGLPFTFNATVVASINASK